MKALTLVTTLLFSLSSLATVKITSFRFVRIANDLNNPLAELCGVVESPTSEISYIKVIVDPGSRVPGTYNTLAGKDGKFCLPVITYRGTADVSLMNGPVTKVFAQAD
jgi:hypothetical protein